MKSIKDLQASDFSVPLDKKLFDEWKKKNNELRIQSRIGCVIYAALLIWIPYSTRFYHDLIGCLLYLALPFTVLGLPIAVIAITNKVKEDHILRKLDLTRELIKAARKKG